MPANHVNVVLAHGAWADGSSWSKVIGPPRRPHPDDHRTRGGRRHHPRRRG